MKILMVLEHFYPYKGGVEFLFFHLAKLLVSNGNHIKVITTLHDSNLPLSETIEGIEIERVKCSNRFLFSVLSIPTILANASNYDLIQTTTYTGALPAWICAKIRRKPIVLTFHEFWGELWERLPYLTKMQKKMYRSFEKMISILSYDRIVAVSQFTKNSLVSSGIKSDKIDVIYNGLDYDEIDLIKDNLSYSDAKTKYILFVGRVGVSKGYDILVPAVDKFLSKYSDYHFKLVMPNYPEKLAQEIMLEIEGMNNYDRTSIASNLTREKLYQTMVQSYCLVIPSYSEGFCFVAAEAQALGVPVISSDQGALQEVVTHRAIKMKDFSIPGLVDSLEEMHNDKWTEGSNRIFTLAESGTAYLSLYESLVNGK